MALARLADLAHRRRGLVILAWLAVLAAALVVLPRVAGDYSADYATPGSQSKAASALVAERFPGRSTDTVDVVWQAPGGVRDAAIEARVRAFIARASTLEGVGEAQPTQVSRDGTIAITRLLLDRPAWDVPDATGKRLIDMAGAAGGNGLRIELGGGIIQSAEGGASPELVGLIAAALVLLLAFGSLVAVGLPLVVALVSLGISASLIGVAALAVDVPAWSPAVAGLIGIGVGIDYALLVLTRFRAALQAGAGVREANV
jgi:RND superfamily putative drug exporter